MKINIPKRKESILSVAKRWFKEKTLDIFTKQKYQQETFDTNEQATNRYIEILEDDSFVMLTSPRLSDDGKYVVLWSKRIIK